MYNLCSISYKIVDVMNWQLEFMSPTSSWQRAWLNPFVLYSFDLEFDRSVTCSSIRYLNLMILLVSLQRICLVTLEDRRSSIVLDRVRICQLKL